MEIVRLASSAPNINGGVFRRTFGELEASVIRPLLSILPPETYRYNESKHIMRFPATGSTVQFGHVQYEKDVYKYQGAEFDFLGFDELTLFTEFQFKFLKSRLRTTKPYWSPCTFATTNPGNVGHAWVKRLWIERDRDAFENKETWEYVPAVVYDNPALIENDPAYVARLEALPEDQKRAMLYGDWDAFAGQYFKEWRKDAHVVRPFLIPQGWRRVICLDYGYSAPSAVLWLAVDPDWNAYAYRELYVTQHTYQALIDRVASLMDPEERDAIDGIVADPALQAKAADTGASFFDVAKKSRFNIIPGTNDRVAGWNVVRAYLKVGEHVPGLPGTARLKVFSTCANLVRTLPTLVYDSVKVEDCDTRGEDHAPDALRYGLVYLAKSPGSLKDVKELNAPSVTYDRRGNRDGNAPIISTQF